MALIIDDNKVNTTINNVKMYYEIIFNENLKDVDVFASTDIDLDTRNFVNFEENTKPNGRYIEPNSITQKSIILTRYEAYYKNGCTAVSTLIHELTHYSDYKKYTNQYCDGDYSKTRKQSNFSGFYMWSEYHAYINQIIHLRRYLSVALNDNDFMNENIIKEEMTEYQLPYYKQNLVESLEIGESFNITSIIKYCARFYVCNYYNKELKIEENVPEVVYEIFPDIVKLYYDLYPLQSYEAASKKFLILSLLLRDFI